MKAAIALAALLVLASTVAFAEGPVADNVDELFGDEPVAKPAEAKTIDNPEAAALETEGFKWGGELTSDAEISLPYGSLPPRGTDEWKGVDDRLDYDLGAKIFFDSRPDRNYRVYGSAVADYPFEKEEGKVRVFELFTDFNWQEKLFFRFGKQTMGWGLSRFYQPADPLSLGVKDPQDPTKELEGPVGLKLSLPIGSHGIYAYVLTKESFTKGLDSAGFEDLGYGLKGEYFLSVPKNPVFSDAELTAGYFYQKKLAPKAIAGVSVGFFDFQLFSDQVLSFGADNYSLDSGTEQLSPYLPPVHTMSKDGDRLFYSATVGAMYVNTDIHLTVYGEYFYNGQGFSDPDYLKELGERYIAEQASGAGGLVSASDLFAYNGAHNTGFSASFDELFGSDKLSCGLFWQANWVDRSGMVVPSFSYAPWKRFSLTLGTKFVYGASDSEFILKNALYDDPTSPTTVRFQPYLKLYFGAGKF
jgi:hypothetical protein